MHRAGGRGTLILRCRQFMHANEARGPLRPVPRGAGVAVASPVSILHARLLYPEDAASSRWYLERAARGLGKAENPTRRAANGLEFRRGRFRGKDGGQVGRLRARRSGSCQKTWLKISILLARSLQLDVPSPLQQTLPSLESNSGSAIIYIQRQ